MSDGLTDERGQSEASMGEFHAATALILEPAPNGGWTITQSQSQMERPKIIGAYSCAADMLEALRENIT